MGPTNSGGVVMHFLMTIWMGAVMSALMRNPGLFEMILFYAGVLALVTAVLRRESFRLRRLTLWDEAVAFWGLLALKDLLSR